MQCWVLSPVLFFLYISPMFFFQHHKNRQMEVFLCKVLSIKVCSIKTLKITMICGVLNCSTLKGSVHYTELSHISKKCITTFSGLQKHCIYVLVFVNESMQMFAVQDSQKLECATCSKHVQKLFRGYKELDVAWPTILFFSPSSMQGE